MSSSDELSLLLAVGADTPGDVQVLPASAHADSQVRPTSAVKDAVGTYDFSEVRQAVDLHSIPGVQDKVSAQMITMPTSDQFSHSILKLNPKSLPGLVENEFAHLLAARNLGLPVAKAKLVSDKHGEAGLLVGRFDRIFAGTSASPQRLALEDATQILGLTPARKYNVSAEDVVEAIAGLSSAEMVARRNLFMQFLFAWLTGNGDLHAKNVSLLNSQGRWAVAPCTICRILSFTATTQWLWMSMGAAPNCGGAIGRGLVERSGCRIAPSNRRLSRPATRPQAWIGATSRSVAHH